MKIDISRSDTFVSCSGRGTEGQLGFGNLDSRSTPSMVLLEFLDYGDRIVQVAAGDNHTILLSSEGKVLSFGSNKAGQTGLGIYKGCQKAPRMVKGCLEGKKVVFVVAGDIHSVCIDEWGDTFTWGSGGSGKLGHGDEENQSTPKRVDGLIGNHCHTAACGSAHTLVLTRNGSVYSFGSNGCGQLGYGTRRPRIESTPKLIKAPLEGKLITHVACGSHHSMATTKGGVLYTWGKGEDGRLGRGSKKLNDVFIPSVVQSLLDFKVVKIDSNNGYSVVLVEEPKRCCFKNLKAMIDDEKCSDIFFVLKDDNDERVHANKGILIGQSEYFRAMFRSDMRESRENVIEVRDCSKTVLLLLLEYLYTGSVEIGGQDIEIVMKLYDLSHRYQENELCVRCMQMLEISDKNAMVLLQTAHDLGSSTLEGIFMEYVVSNFGTSFKREMLESLSPTLMSELLDSIYLRANKRARLES